LSAGSFEKHDEFARNGKRLRRSVIFLDEREGEVDPALIPADV